MANGKVEKFHKFLINTIATSLKADQSNWDQLIDTCLFTYRISLNRTLNENPFFLLYGRDPVLPQDLFLPLANNHRNIEAEDINEYKLKQLKILQRAYEKLNMQKVHDRAKYKEYYDRSHKPVHFDLDSFVMLYTPRTKVGLSTKFLPQWRGPFRVVHQISPVNYRINSCDGKKTMVVHVQRLSKYRPWKRGGAPTTS